jgi:hypothetical protein
MILAVISNVSASVAAAIRSTRAARERTAEARARIILEGGVEGQGGDAQKERIAARSRWLVYNRFPCVLGYGCNYG